MCLGQPRGMPMRGPESDTKNAKGRRSLQEALGVGRKVVFPAIAIALACIGSPRRVSAEPASRGKQSVAASMPPIVEWGQDVSLPDDVLFVRHVIASSGLVFLASLDADGRVKTIKPISGFSLYLVPAAEQIKGSAHLSALAGKTVVFRAPDPLRKYASDTKSFRGKACTPSTDLLRLYQFGAYLRVPEMGDAAPCYRYILERNPNSLAGRWGAAQFCRLAKDAKCEETYLQSIAASNPEFIDARVGLARIRGAQEGYKAYNRYG
jgi:hypothetical protein